MSAMSSPASLLAGLMISLMGVSGPLYGEPDALIIALPPEGYPPYVITVDTPGAGPLPEGPSGIIIDVLRQAADGAGIAVSFTKLPELRSLQMLDTGAIDGRMESSSWVAHPEDYLWSEPITAINDVFVFSRFIVNSFETGETMKGAEIVTHLGYVYPTLEPLFASGDIIRFDRQTEEAMLMAVYQGDATRSIPRKRAAVMDELVARWFIQRESRYQGHFHFSRRRVDSASLQFQVARKPGHDVLVERLNRQIVLLKANGTVDQLVSRTVSASASAAVTEPE